MEKLCLKNTVSILHISFGIRCPNFKGLCLRNTILVLNIGYTKIVGVFGRVV